MAKGGLGGGGSWPVKVIICTERKTVSWDKKAWQSYGKEVEELCFRKDERG